jgi:antidote-toxin recognition MazE-like antitoxin
MSARQTRLRAQGLRPVQHWVPDLRNPRVRAEIRREAALPA